MHVAALSNAARWSIIMLVFALWSQMGIGINVIWKSVPIEWASSHQIGAMSVLSIFLFSMHCCRKVDPRHMANLMGKLRIEDKAHYDHLMKSVSAKHGISKKDVNKAMAEMKLKQAN